MGFARTGQGGPRLGVVVSARFLPRAVDRNLFKRIVREAFRARRADLPAGDVLMRLRQTLKGRDRSEWSDEVATSAAKLLATVGS